MARKINLQQKGIEKFLLKERIKRNLSQVEMAKFCNLSYPVYTGIENGKYPVSFKILYKISKPLEISVEDLTKIMFQKEEK